MATGAKSWQQASRVFDQQAAEYDGWFEDSLLFDIELAAIRSLLTPLAGPRLEVGVGPGRFGRELAVDIGVDPAHAPLHLAAHRGIMVCQGVGEDIPLADSTVGSVFLLFTLCFVNDPARVIAECHRVLRAGGHLVLAVIPASGPWGQFLAGKRDNDHPFYRYARFYDQFMVEDWFCRAGFDLVEKRSALFQRPEELTDMEDSRSGLLADAGLWLLVGRAAGS